MTRETAGDPLLRRWHEADALLAEALELAHGARAAFLDEHCADDDELRRLMEDLLRRTDDPTTSFSSPLARPEEPGHSPALHAETFSGMRLGPYELEHLVGRGGLGMVYQARRVDGGFEQRVAVKLLLATASPSILPRFERERSILASLDHPYVARLHDGGISPDGRPYLVMEFVDGRPINRFCEEEELTVRARLRLFLRVCDAVASAHARLVVHRDLKPSNILVTPDGSPKLLDFGIARILEADGDDGPVHLTLTGSRALSPAYASPEQIRGEPVAIASDVFQLGTLLYLLLSGHRPHERSEATPASLVSAILERDPPVPSQAVGDEGVGGVPAHRVRAQLRGDLDAVVMKALRKEPARRYGSVAELAEDVRRHLDGMPVRAGPDSLGYRMGKFARRNRVGVALGATVAVALLAGVAGLGVHANRLEAERDRARLEAARAEAATGFLLDLFDLAGESGGRDTLTVGALLARGEARLDERVGDHPLIHIDLLRALEAANDRVGLDGAGMRLMDRRATAVKAFYGPDHLETMRALASLGSRRRLARHWAEAIEALEEAVAIHEALPPTEAGSDEARSTLAAALASLSVAYRETGRTDEALDAVQAAISFGRLTSRGGSAEQTKDHAAQLAFVLRGLDRLDEAAALYEDAIALGREDDGDVPAGILNNYASLLRAMDRHAEAEPLLREARERLWPHEGDPELSLDVVHINLGSLLTELGRHDDAVIVAREAEALMRTSFPPDHWRVARAVGEVGVSLLYAGECTTGEPLLREAAEIYASGLGDEHAWSARARSVLAHCLIELERFDEAETLLLEARPLMLADRNMAPVPIRKNLEALVRVYERTDRPIEAERYRALLAELDGDP